MRKSVFFLVVAALMLSVGVAMAQSTFTVPFSPVGNSGVSGDAALTAADAGTNVSYSISGLKPAAHARVALHGGTCAAPSASLAVLADLVPDQSGNATATVQVLFRGTESVTLGSIADGEHVMTVAQSGQTVACAWIPKVETNPVGMPRTGGEASLLIGAAMALMGVTALGIGLSLRKQYAILKYQEIREER